ncbi:MAG: hypothetical protein OXF68_14255, partial [Gammaproteobacteria bacterium]|nr:hypothetical protein [Gammaproteobacteria bacterium]
WSVRARLSWVMAVTAPRPFLMLDTCRGKRPAFLEGKVSSLPLLLVSDEPSAASPPEANPRLNRPPPRALTIRLDQPLSRTKRVVAQTP